MLAELARLLDLRRKVRPKTIAPRLESADGSDGPMCPSPKTAYSLRKAGHYDYTVMDGKVPVGHAFGLDAFAEGTMLWTVRAYDVDREVYSLRDAKEWLGGGNPTLPDEAL